jgi:predicted restriction endonuclease
LWEVEVHLLWKNTSNPVHIIYQSIDFDNFTQNENLLEVYRWKPSVAGMTSKTKVVKKGIITKERKQSYRKPDQTERQGLVTSRVGQGFYRQQIIEKWGGKCPISGVNILSILIASHIVSWSESNDDERLDVENGILLSPLYNSLFDKHLISFDNDGRLLVSSKVNSENIERLGLLKDIKITLSKGMKKYLLKHREKFRRI